MGGYGSGRPGNTRKAEDCHSLDIYKMKRERCLEVGSRGNVMWSRNEKEIARIRFHCTGSDLALDYRFRRYGGDWEDIKQSVPLIQTDCHYGGERTYASCPGVVNGLHCGRRVGKLFLGGRYFLCRHCYNVSYSSQSEPKPDRALRRANKIRMALGGEPGGAHWIASKPKGMWQRTYQRKRWIIQENEHQANIAFLRKFGHMLGKDDLEILF